MIRLAPSKSHSLPPRTVRTHRAHALDQSYGYFVGLVLVVTAFVVALWRRLAMNDSTDQGTTNDPPRLPPAERLTLTSDELDSLQAQGNLSGTYPRSPELEQLSLVVRALWDLQAREQLLGNRPLAKVYAVPRRFDMATLFVVSTAFALLFVVLGYAGFSPASKLLWCFSISFVGTAQAMLYGGRAPRLASVVSGGCVMAAMAPWFFSQPDSMIAAFIFAFVFGLAGGYLIGALVGGVFLVADYCRQHWPYG